MKEDVFEEIYYDKLTWLMDKMQEAYELKDTSAVNAYLDGLHVLRAFHDKIETWMET